MAITPKNKLQTSLDLPNSKKLLLGINGEHPWLKELQPGLQLLPIDIVIVSPTPLNKQPWPVLVSKKTPVGLDALLIWPADQLVQTLLDTQKNGIVPLCPEHRNLHSLAQNWDPVNEKGNAFLYNPQNAWGVYGGLIRLLENYRFPYDWENLLRHLAEQEK